MPRSYYVDNILLKVPCVCVCVCVCRWLLVAVPLLCVRLCCLVFRHRSCDGLIPFQGIIPTVYRIKKQKRLVPNKRAVDS
jgi:hypothetical protein